jgi:hypothetical protein
MPGPLVNPTFIILGGRGEAALRRTLEALPAPPQSIWIAAATEQEVLVSAGLGQVHLISPWPGQARSLPRLLEHIPKLVGDQVVQVLSAGEPPNQRGLALMSRTPRPAFALPSAGRFVPKGRLGVRLLRNAVVEPGSGMTVQARVLPGLVSSGWFHEEPLTLMDLERLGGSAVLLPRQHSALLTEPASLRELDHLTVTLVIPAHNEEAFIGDTLRAIQNQTRKPEVVMVIDDGSTDRTGDIAREMGAHVVRTHGTGSKGAAINEGLPHVHTDAIILVDADTGLHPEAVAELMRGLESGLDATHGAVIPANTKGLWARGRLFEYAAAIRFYKRVQQAVGRVMVLSGCILAVRTEALWHVGGFQSRTMVEDLDLTWTLHREGLQVGYSPKAIAYPIEPANFAQYKGQMRRWTRGFFQAVSVHARTLHNTRSLAFLVVASLWDVVTAPLVGLLFIVAAFMGGPTFVLGGLILAWHFAWTIIALVAASRVVGLLRAIRALPASITLGMFNTYFFLEGFVSEWILRRRLVAWAKGH